MSARQPRPAASFAAGSKRWTSSAARPGSQNAQRNYERYLALARAEAQVDCIAQIKQRADSGRLEAQPGMSEVIGAFLRLKRAHQRASKAVSFVTLGRSQP